MKRWMQQGLALFLSCLLLTQPVWAAEEVEDVPKGQILIEMTTGTVLFEENADEQLPMASITKLMGLILIGEAMEREDLSKSDMLTCSEYAKSMGGSEIWLKAGEQMSVDDLLKAVMIASANDAMVVFAEQIGSTEDGFVQMMNQKAQELGLSNTHFVNATGFDEEDHYTSARDVAKMAQELQQYPELLEYSTVWMDSLRNGETMLVNTNRLVRFYQGTTGLKTGTTDGAGHCLCATAQRGDLLLCSVVLGCKTSDGRFESSKALLDYGFSNYCMYRPEPVILEPLDVIHGTQKQVELTTETPNGLIISREEAQNITVQLPELEALQAPLQEGQQVAEVKLLSGEKEIAVYPVRVKETVEELNFGKCMELLLKECISMEEKAAD
ncbi:MAG: D-alanyl-D-alanine carboxypeptidase [Oscillospiraceae bacterium]|nr:D-alanyl-D-alanine carboxypeptidase [Oscillospiraceae bacterium]